MAKKKKWFHYLFRRRIFVISILLVQVALLLFLVVGAGIFFHYSYIFLHFLSIIVCIYVINKHEKAGFKLTWIFIILLFPFFGGIMYILFHAWLNPTKFKEAMSSDSRETFLLPGNRLEEFINVHPEFRTQAQYLQNFAGFPVYKNTKQVYLDSGESYYKKVLEELEKAENYIFLEFFILKEGYMLNSIVNILEKKAKAGLDIRIIYDDLGCFLTLPHDYPQVLAQKGIKCMVFNPFRPIVSSLHNNRDHRKILAIDGKIAFTGGLNLADEYINIVERFGHWKDSAIMLEGEGAWSLTLIFLQTWNLSRKKESLPAQTSLEADSKKKDDYVSFYPWKDSTAQFYGTDLWGYVQPYADSPLDSDNVGEHVYVQIINKAEKYVYINTPYLILDDTLLSALTLAAKSGVDVRIITPHRWDKKFVAITSRSYYRRLIKAGVKVYEYTSGFNHGKSFVSDDRIATVGTTNLDFRSLYLHFECGVLVYASDAITAIKNDFLRTLPVSQEVTLKDCANSVLQRIVPDILRIFAPLM